MLKKILCFSALMVFSGLSWASSTHANSISFSLDFKPPTQTVSVGDSFDVDIDVSGLEAGGLDEIVSAFDLDVSFDPLILSPTSVTFGPFLGDLGFFEAFADFIFSPGVVNFAELSLLSDSDLAFLQPYTFTLATIEFEAIAVGLSPLEFTAGVGDIKGRNAAILPLTAGSGNVNVVPEPSTLLLLGSGLAALVLWRRRGTLRPH